MKRFLALLLAAVLLLGAFGSTALAADAGSDTLVVYTKSGARRTFQVGDTFTYTYWLYLKPQYVLDQISTHILYDDQCLTLDAASAEFPNFNDNTAVTADNPGDFRFHKSAFNNANGRVFAQSPAQLVGVTFTVTRGGTTYIRCLMEELQVENLSGTECDFVDDFVPRAGTVMFSTYDYLQTEKPTIATTPLDEREDVSWFYVTDAATGAAAPAGLKFLLTGQDETNGTYVERTATTDEYGFIGFGSVPYGDYYIRCESAADGTAYLVQERAQEIPQVSGGALALDTSLTVRAVSADATQSLTVDYRWLNETIAEGQSYTGDRPASLYLELTGSDGVAYGQRYVASGEDASGSVTFSYLPTTAADGSPLSYTLATSTLEQYSTSVTATDTGFQADFTYLNNHTWETTRTDPTCTESGEINSVCSDCAAVCHTDLPALGHDVKTSGKEATCTEAGSTVSVCARCGLRYVTNTDALGHDWGDWVVLKAAVGGEDGLAEHSCKRCGVTEQRVMPGTNHQHSYTAVVTAPTCTEGGYTEYVCACGDVGATANYTAALGHDYSGDSSVVEISSPTCTEDGLMEYTCVRCGEIHDEVLEKTGHDWQVVEGTETEADCTHSGKVQWKCGDCGSTKWVTTAKLGHDWGEWIVDQEATATAEGAEHRLCKRCGERQDAVIPKLDHTHEYSIAVVTEPTCTEQGYTTYQCSCGASMIDEDSYVLALGHSYTEVSRVAATEHTQGVVTYQCTNCEKYRYELLPILPDSWKNPYWDVSESDWFYESVGYVAQNGLMVGTSDTRFSPNASMSRAMLVTVLYRMAGEPSGSWAGTPFTDLRAGAYYTAAVNWAYANGIVTGTSATTFSPDENVTRQQMVAIFYRYAAYQGYDTTARASLAAFSDADDVSNYAVKAMQWGVATGLISGVKSGGETLLLPKEPATRAQAAKVIASFDQWRLTALA